MRAGIVRDDRGAVMLIGLFMAVILVGSIYYLSGIARTIVVRERMQDAADTGAYTQAKMHARGMNFIALSNVTMTAYTAIWTAVEAIHDLAGIGYDEADDECHDEPPECCGSMDRLGGIETDAGSRLRGIRREVRQVVRTADRANKAIAVAMPGAATGRFLDSVERTYGPEAGASFTWPAYNRLPVEVAPMRRTLCDDAEDQASGIVDRPFDQAHLCDDADHEIDDERDDSVESARNRVCSDLRGRSRRVSRRGFFHRLWNPDPARVQIRPRNQGGAGGEPLAPRRGRLRVTEDAQMGGEAFQVRVMVRGNRQGLETPGRGVEAMALFGSEQDSPGKTYEQLRRLGRLTFAQGEFYFDGNADREVWLLRMNWESRLRRFRPSGGAGGAQSACRQWGGGSHCRNIGRIVNDLGGLAIH